MSSQNAVGFGFQADVVNISALALSLVGGFLKAISDRGVDALAVAAAIHLGNCVQVRTSLESTVRTHLASRGSSRSVLNKVLSIGWGHSELAIELSQSKAGTNAILLIGALAAGRYPLFRAAQCLSELLSLSGCKKDQIPNVDALKGLVEYLAPFTFDLEFSKVLELITTEAERKMRSRGDITESYEMPRRLSDLGDAPMLAGAIKQLTLTAGRGERMYMILRKHGSWLPAFASHILGMEVELRYTRKKGRSGPQSADKTVFGNTSTLDASGSEQPKESEAQDDKCDDFDPVIWACAGDQGSVVFELGSSDHGLISLYESTGSRTEIVNCPDSVASLEIDTLLQDALKTQLSRRPEIDDGLSEGIQQAIARRSWDLLDNIEMGATPSVPGMFEVHHHINGPFDPAIALEETLGSMGFSETSRAVIGSPILKTRGVPRLLSTLAYLDPRSYQDLTMSCPGPHTTKCLCGFVQDLIQEFAASAVALMQCRFDASQLRVAVMAHTTSRPTTHWSRQCANTEDRRKRSGFDNSQLIDFEYSHLMDHLCVLLFGHNLPLVSKAHEIAPGVAGFSFGAHTVFYTALMQHDAYDALGRIITITSGRVSVDGLLRNVILENLDNTPVRPSTARRITCPNPLATGAFALAVGHFIEPHYQPSDINVFLHATASENAILVRFSVGRLVSKSIEVSLLRSIQAFLAVWRMPECRDDTHTPVKVQRDMNMKIVGFHLEHELSLSKSDGLTLIALHGNKLHQLLTCGLYSTRSWVGPSTVTEPNCTTIFQLEACLKCCIKIARKAKHPSCIIMGG
ncbi:hypothetical protein VSDG_07140 [Cytospora chrysosperma]|uniref:Uncharacterized protein n=1 Tax=Cytospora chrysosperma TaxID=252740 RepID=A0A423VKA2_CYTCH|nr:hypothetical protein VSDG_07140 [Valsa sordida]